MRFGDHLKKFHETEAAHHVQKSEHHNAMGNLHEKLEKLQKASDSTSKDMADVHGALAEQHYSTAAKHDDMAAFHTTAVEACEKATAAADLAKGDRIAPDRVSGVVRAWPDITLQPRHGAPTEPAKPNVPIEFEHLVRVSDDD